MGVLAAIGLAAAACGGTGGGDDDGEAGAQFTEPEDEGTPQRGGRVVYALEAETGGGWCLPRAQLAAGGIQVAGAIYDTLTIPADDGEGGVKYAPFLAESVTPNADFTEWVVTLREGVVFHDGTPLTADVVKQNFDAYKEGILFQFVLEDLQSVDVVDELTVSFKTAVPWVAFDATLWATGRTGIVAPAQLADPGTCDRNLIGTGPFRIINCEQEECGWNPNEKFVAEANPDYWRQDENGEQLPYLDGIEFRPIPVEQSRLDQLEGGELDMLHTSGGNAIATLRDQADADQVNLLESDFAAEVSYTMLSINKPPFDNKTARLAFATALNPEQIILETQAGVVERAFQPFSEDNIAYVDPEDLEFPEYDPDEARELVEQYEQETGQELSFTLGSTTAPETLRLAELVQQQAQAAGMNVEIDQLEQTQYINVAISADFQAHLWRNHPGGDPDTQAIWWRSTNRAGETNPVNFGRIPDPELDRLFLEGRSETDPAARAEIYQQISQRLASEVYNLWGWYTLWGFAAEPEVHGIFPPQLPDGSDPVIIASVQSVVGLWRE